MKKILPIIALTFLLFNISYAHSPSGAYIIYKSLGNEKFVVYCHIFRDCRGIPAAAPSLLLKCENTGKTVSLSTKLLSIKEITTYCPTKGKQCYPANTYGTGSGIEEQIYYDTLDFNNRDSAFKSCCTIKFGLTQCCRSSAITTGASGSMFFINSTLEKCKANNNSSPVFTYNYNSLIECNKALRFSFIARDADNDSLSYNLVDPKTSWNTTVTWSSGFNSKNPLTPYYPAGSKSKIPQPEANPPIGTYLDSTTGYFSTTPTNCNEATVFDVAVSEWRKDKNGKYEKIGEVTREVMNWFETGYENKPTLSGNFNINACEGEKLTLSYYTYEKPYYVPPSTKYYNDSMKLTWVNYIPNSTIKYDSSNVKHQAAIFEWTPQKGDAAKLPFIFSFRAYDNACPYYGEVFRNVKITVYPKIKITDSVALINKNKFAFKINISNKNYPYLLSNNVKSQYNYDSRAFYFKSSKNITSDLEIDTLVFLKNGTFIINHFFTTNVMCNQQTLSDTVKIENIMEISITKSADTVLCKNIKSDFVCKTLNAKKPVTYTWKTKNTSVSDTSGKFSGTFNTPDTLYVWAKDANGNTSSSWVKIKISELPDISAGTDKIACTENSITTQAINKNTDTLKWQWTFNKAIVSNDDTLITTLPGSYIVWATNKYFCINSDTMVRSNYKTDIISLISGKYCQDKNSLKQNEIFNSNPDNFPVLQWSMLKSLKNSFGNYNTWNKLMIDEDPTLNYNFNLYFGKNLIDLDTVWQDSLKFILRAWDKNNCFSSDTNTISIIKVPEIEFGLPSFSVCRNDSVNLNPLVITKGDKYWYPLNINGYDQWPIPVTSEIKDGIIKSKFFKPAEGKYKVELTSKHDKCFDKDSVDIHIFPSPIPLINWVIKEDSIHILDNSLYAEYRKWYVNGISKGNKNLLSLNKIEIDDKPIKLELSNSFSCFTDTVFSINTIKINTISKNNILVYPNPANNVLNVVLNTELSNSKWKISNIEGKTLLQGNLSGLHNIIELSKLADGLYYIYITNEQSKVILSFSKLEK